MAISSNLIQIKRSQSSGLPSSLANGELAWASTNGILYIGDFGTVRAVGGTRNPGVLTANQALVANSTSGIDRIITSNVISRSISANNIYSPQTQIATSTKGYLLSVDAGGNTFWYDAAGLSVSDTYVQNTDSRVLSGNLTFSGAHTIFSGANVEITGANTQITNLNVTNINRSPTVTLSGAVTGSGTLSNLGSVTISTTYSTITLSTDTTGDYVATVKTVKVFHRSLVQAMVLHLQFQYKLQMVFQ